MLPAGGEGVALVAGWPRPPGRRVDEPEVADAPPVVATDGPVTTGVGVGTVAAACEAASAMPATSPRVPAAAATALRAGINTVLSEALRCAAEGVFMLGAYNPVENARFW